MNRARSVIVLALVCLAAVSASGCLAALPGGAQAAASEAAATTAYAPDWYAAALARDPGHDHADRTQHEGASTANFQLLGHDPLRMDAYGGKPSGAYFCGDSAQRTDGTRLTAVSVFNDRRVAFALVDVTDASAPRKVGEFSMQGVSNYDTAITRDGRFAVVGYGGLARVPSAPAAGALGLDGAARALTFRGCDGAERLLAGPDLAATSGAILVDLSDPARPTYADHSPAPGVNVHSVATAADGADHYVITSVVNLAHSASYFAFDRIVDAPLGARLVRVATFAPPPASATPSGDAAAPTWNGHVDATMQRHPLDGHLYAYLAAWDGGLLTVDLTVPAAPVLVSTWVPSGGSAVRSPFQSCWDRAVHSVFPIEGAWEGRHYLLVGQECPFKDRAGTRGGSVFVVDNTQPLLPRLVSGWHLPEDTGPWTMQYQASPHYLTVVNRTAFVSMYHAGLWAMDLSDVAQPAAVGAYLPTIAPPAKPAHGFAGAPSSLQVDAFPDGTLALNDESSGLYVLRFDEGDPAPRALPFPAR